MLSAILERSEYIGPTSAHGYQSSTPFVEADMYEALTECPYSSGITYYRNCHKNRAFSNVCSTNVFWHICNFAESQHKTDPFDNNFQQIELKFEFTGHPK
jgi:hypothetical protein